MVADFGGIYILVLAPIALLFFVSCVYLLLEVYIFIYLLLLFDLDLNVLVLV